MYSGFACCSRSPYSLFLCSPLERKRNSENYGSLAQLVERHVYTVDVIGSIPVGPTANPGTARYRGFCLPSYRPPRMFRSEVKNTSLKGSEENPVGSASPRGIKLHSTYI